MSHQTIYIDQGDGQLLSQLAYHPPEWLVATVALVGLATIAGVAYRLMHRDPTFTLAEQKYMQTVLATVTAVGTLTLALMSHTDLAYAVRVVLAVVGGAGVVWAGQTNLGLRLGQRIAANPYERQQTIWLCLGAAAQLLPGLVALSQFRLWGGQIPVVLICLGMVVYNAQQASDQSVNDQVLPASE